MKLVLENRTFGLKKLFNFKYILLPNLSSDKSKMKNNRLHLSLQNMKKCHLFVGQLTLHSLTQLLPQQIYSIIYFKTTIIWFSYTIMVISGRTYLRTQTLRETCYLIWSNSEPLLQKIFDFRLWGKLAT